MDRRLPMKQTITLLALILCASSVYADDFTTIDGDHYTNCTIKRVEPDGIIVADADGVRKLKFKNLPPEIGQKYNFDPAKAEAFKVAQNQAAIASENQAIKAQNDQVAAMAAASATPAPVSVPSSAVANHLPKTPPTAAPTSFEVSRTVHVRVVNSITDTTTKKQTETMTILSRDRDGLNVVGENGAQQFIRAEDLPPSIKAAYGF